MVVLIVSFFFLMIIWKCFKITRKTDDLFGKFLAFGISFGIAFQAVLNLMMVVGLIPVTGVTLSFLAMVISLKNNYFHDYVCLERSERNVLFI